MNPSHVKFLDTIAKLNNFLTFFGLNSVREVGRGVNNIRYVVSRKRIVYCVFHAFLLLAIFAYHLKFINRLKEGTTFVWSLICIYLTYSGSYQTLFLLMMSIFQSKRYANLLHDMVHAEFEFRDCKADEMTKRSGRLFISFSIIFVCFFIGDVISRRNEGLSLEMFLNITVGYIYLSYNIITVSQFAIAQFWLQKAFIRIKKDFIRHCSIGKMETKIFLGNTEKFVAVLEDLGNDLMMANLKETKNKTTDNPNESFSNKEVVENIQKLRLLYHNVFSISREMDAFFANRSLIVIITNLLTCTILLFYGLQNLALYLQTSEDSHKSDMSTAFRASLLSLASISGFIWPCGSTCKEAYSISLIIQDHLVRVTNEEIKAELKEFAVQVQQEKVHFSPHGLFVLRNRMFLSVLTAITSHLVILIQLIPVSTLKLQD